MIMIDDHDDHDDDLINIIQSNFKIRNFNKLCKLLENSTEIMYSLFELFAQKKKGKNRD